MSEWKARRFWKEATVERHEDAFEVRLDGRPVNTPSKQRLTLPTKEMADRIAAEWQAQDETIDPRTMPWTRSANSAHDKVMPQIGAVREHLAEYAATDMLSYRAEGPDALVARQAAMWDPLLDRVAKRYEARLAVTTGVMPVAQNDAVIARLGAVTESMSAFELTGFHDLVTLPGSFVIGLAAINRWEDDDDLWNLGRLDELWQIEQWGRDDEAEELAAAKRCDFLHAAAFFRASR